MIDKKILFKYKTFKIPHQIEKDYLQDLMLYGIYSFSTNEFVFKGGTAFSKFYYSDRFSEDLDFTMQNIKTDRLVYAKSIVDSVIESMLYPSEYKKGKDPEMNEYGTISTTVLVQGPRYNNKPSTLQQIKFEFSTKSNLLKESSTMSRTPVYADAKGYVALVMSKEEILTEKFRALLSPTRKHRERDLYDIFFFLNKQTEINKSLIIEKLVESDLNSNIGDVPNSINSIEGIWKNLEPFVQHKLEEYEIVKEFVLRKFNGMNQRI